MKPTKKGVSLTLRRWQTFTNCVDIIQEALQSGKNFEKSVHLGGNYYASKEKDYWCVDIRKWWIPPNNTQLTPTRKGITLRPTEFNILVQSIASVDSVVPELSTIQPCYMSEDHQNQLGALMCSECTPDAFIPV